MGSESIDEQAAFYDERWSDFSYANRLRMRRASEILRRISDARLHEPSIVELGSGAGWLGMILAQFGPTVGVELSPLAVREATVRYPAVEFICADVLEWTTDRRFDVAVSHEVIEHVPDQRRYLEVAREVLEPGALLVLTTPNASTMRAMPPERAAAWTNQPIEDWRTASELRALAASVGFESVRVSTVLAGVGSSGLRYAVLNTVPQRLSRRLSRRAELEAVRNRFGMGLHLVLTARA